MNTILQHYGEYINLREGMKYSGCFRTSDEAEAWRRKVQSKGAGSGFLSAKQGVMPYGEWENHFDVEAYYKRLDEWLGDYQISGRD